MSDSATPWTVARQAPPSVGFPRQEYCIGLPFLPPRDLPNPGIEPPSPASPALAEDSLLLSHLGSPISFLVFLPNLKQYCLSRLKPDIRLSNILLAVFLLREQDMFSHNCLESQNSWVPFSNHQYLRFDPKQTTSGRNHFASG